jgi:hypothetical protein
MEQYKKIDEYSIEITHELPIPEVVKTTYERSFIENQIKTITEDRDNYVALRNTEIAECESILVEMDKLNITSKVEPIVEKVISEEVLPVEEIIN